MRLSVAVLTVSIVAGCAGFDAGKNTALLRVGMTSGEVIETLGQEPVSSSAKDGKTVLKFALHESWKGLVPWYMTFGQEGKLETWRADEEEWKRDQDAMESAWGLDQVEASTPSEGAGPPVPPESAPPDRPVTRPTVPVQVGPNDPELQRYFAGRYMSYSGSTHRVLLISSAGRFLYTTESSYSGLEGQVGGVWGAASQSADGGLWSIQGDRTRGQITFSYNGGKQETISYRVGDERGVLILNGITFAYEAPAD